MAQHFPIPILNGRSDSTNPATVTVVQDANLAKWVSRHPASVTSDMHFAIFVPDNYSGAGSCTVRAWFRTPSGANNPAWQAHIVLIDNAGNLTTAPTAATMSISLNSANTYSEFTGTFALTDARLLGIMIRRAGGSDSHAATCELMFLCIEYDNDVSLGRGYIWTPANALNIDGGSNVALTIRAISGSPVIRPHVAQFAAASSDGYVDGKITLPVNYLGNLRWRPVFAANAGTGNVLWRLDAANAVNGMTSSPVLQAGTERTVNVSNADRVYLASDFAVDVAPQAQSDYFFRLLRRDSQAGDTYAAAVDLFGILWTMDLSQKSPAVLRFDPGLIAQSGSDAASLVRVMDSGHTKLVTQYPAGGTRRGDYLAFISSLYSSGGVIKLKWRCNSPPGQVARLRADIGTAALGAATDPALTIGTVVSALNAGAGVINESSLPVGAFAASRALSCRVLRLADGSDTVNTTVEVLSVHGEFNL